MKKYIFTLFLIVAATGISVRAHGQTPDYLGLPGDNLNLFAVMKLFQESPTLEVFERELNNEQMHINNLDLDQDGRIDYIRVVDNADGNYHTIVLQDAISPRDIQDVAVFTVYRDRNGNVSIQLTGDEALYGRNYIVEPNYADLEYDETPNPGYVARENVVVNRTTTVEVASWPLIRFMFMPTYVVWQSPWHYNYYPSYWRPWRPYYWHYYYGYHYNYDPYYYGHYRVYHQHRSPYWHDTYYSQRRHYSPVVTSRVESGSYRKTYSRPEARKAGYDMYYKKNPDQVARRSSRPIEDPVARRSTSQRGTATTGERRTLGESRSTNQSSGNVQSGTRTRTLGDSRSTNQNSGNVKSGTRTRTTGTANDTRVSTTEQKPARTLGNRTQTQTRTSTNRTQTATPTNQSQTRTQSESRSSEKSSGTQVRGSEQNSGNSGSRSSQQTRTETRSGSERRSSDANTSGASRKPAEKKESPAAKPQENRGARRTAE